MRTTTLTLVAITISASLCWGDSPSTNDHPHRTYSYVPWYRLHASTWQEGYLRGWAELARGIGEYNYNISLAAINLEEARSRDFENGKKYAENYFEIRHINREARANERGPGITPEQAYRVSKSRLPQRLDAYQYDLNLGRLNWPSVLANSQFAKSRDQIDELIKSRNVSNRKTDRMIKVLASNLQMQLKSQIREFNSNDYIDARKFLVSLQHEMNHPSVPAGLASN